MEMTETMVGKPNHLELSRRSPNGWLIMRGLVHARQVNDTNPSRSIAPNMNASSFPVL